MLLWILWRVLLWMLRWMVSGTLLRKLLCILLVHTQVNEGSMTPSCKSKKAQEACLLPRTSLSAAGWCYRLIHIYTYTYTYTYTHLHICINEHTLQMQANAIYLSPIYPKYTCVCCFVSWLCWFARILANARKKRDLSVCQWCFGCDGPHDLRCCLCCYGCCDCGCYFWSLLCLLLLSFLAPWLIFVVCCCLCCSWCVSDRICIAVGLSLFYPVERCETQSTCQTAIVEVMLGPSVGTLVCLFSMPMFKGPMDLATERLEFGGTWSLALLASQSG